MLNKRALALAIKAGIVQASDKQMIVDANWENLEKFTNLIAEECAQISDTISKTTLKNEIGPVFESIAAGAGYAACHIRNEFGLE